MADVQLLSAPGHAGHVELILSGRLDTASSDHVKQKLDAALQGVSPDFPVVLNIGELDYISSSGLRIVLGLAKRFRALRVTEANDEVYHVFEITGFTKIVNITRALRRLSIEGCEEIGRGGVGIVYRVDDETIVKVFREGTTQSDVQREVDMAKKAFVLGMPTAISFDMVRVGSQYGLVYELLRADTMSACIRRHPDQIDAFSRHYADMMRHMHTLEVPPDSTIPSAKAVAVKAVEFTARYLEAQDIDIMLHIVDSIPEANRLLHCDLQTKNIMMQGDEPMLIDMGEVGYGHPMIDLGFCYSSMVKLVGDSMQIIGLTSEMASQVWHKMSEFYFEGQPADLVAHRLQQIQTVAVVRNFSWLSLSESFPESLIAQVRSLATERLRNQKEHLYDVCRTFHDWTL